MEWTLRGNSDSFGARGSSEHGGTWPGLQGWTINHRRCCVPPPSPWAGGSILFYICHNCHIFILRLGYKIIKPYVVLAGIMRRKCRVSSKI